MTKRRNYTMLLAAIVMLLSMAAYINTDNPWALATAILAVTNAGYQVYRMPYDAAALTWSVTIQNGGVTESMLVDADGYYEAIGKVAEDTHYAHAEPVDLRNK